MLVLTVDKIFRDGAANGYPRAASQPPQYIVQQRSSDIVEVEIDSLREGVIQCRVDVVVLVVDDSVVAHFRCQPPALLRPASDAHDALRAQCFRDLRDMTANAARCTRYKNAICCLDQSNLPHPNERSDA